MFFDETISFRKRHKKIFVPYIKDCIREIFIRMNCRIKTFGCDQVCCKKDTFKKDIAENIYTEISNGDLCSRDMPRNIPLVIQQESYLSEMYLKDLICGVYKICVNARVSFSLLIYTMIILRIFEKKNICKKQIQPKPYQLIRKVETQNALLEANFLIKFIIALIVTQKYYNDYSYTMSDYHNLLLHIGGKELSFVQLTDMNSYERIFLTNLNHELRIDEILVEKEKKRMIIDENEQNQRSMLSWLFYTFRCR